MTPDERREDVRDGILEALFLVICVVLVVALAWVLA